MILKGDLILRFLKYLLFQFVISDNDLHSCLITLIKMNSTDWSEKAKRLLKSELVRRGVNSDDLVDLLHNIGVEETKASVDSKISRGTFSAAFLIQCLNAIGVKTFVPEVEADMVLSEPVEIYKSRKRKTKVS